jgi:hypothetical protein
VALTNWVKMTYSDYYHQMPTCQYYGVFDAAVMVCLCGFMMERVGVSNIEKRCDGISGEWQWFSYNRCLHNTRVFFGLEL